MEATAQDWFEERELTSVEVKDFENYCEKMYEQRDLVAKRKEELKEEERKLDKMKSKIISYLEDFGKTKYLTKKGTVLVQEKFSVRVPKDPEAKAAFFAWLEEKGIKDQITTVASPTLNSLYKQELEASENPDFRIPGIEEPTVYKLLQLRNK